MNRAFALPLDRSERAELARLREEVAELQETVTQLREALVPPVAFPQRWKLSPTQARLLAALHAAPGAYMRREALMVALYGPAYEADPKIVDVYLHHLRRKLGPYGIEIRTIYAQGFRLQPGSSAIVAEALERARDEP